jgi:N-sulfoglucosamine sulfohydrolase
MLTGQAPHRLDEGANLYGFLPARFPVYPNRLEASGYAVGFCGKGWAPGKFQAGGRTRNPAGPTFKDFAAFLKSVPTNQPFAFWFGSHDPHRPYEKGSGLRAGMKLADIVVPPDLPDCPEVRGDILDYYFAVQRFDRDLGECLRLLAERGQSSNTLVVVSGDNGWPFPHGKANLYDAGTHQPLAIRWPGHIKPGLTCDGFVSLTDLAPTFLEAAGLTPPPSMTGRSLLALAAGKPESGRDAVFVERERHANARKGDLSYPARAIRTKDFLYIRNFRPARWPAGDPEKWVSVGPFGDCDASPSKDFILDHRDTAEGAKFFHIAFEKRPAEELYFLGDDPHQLHNVVQEPKYAATRKDLRRELEEWMTKTADPRATKDDDRWDGFTYFGPP